MAVDRKRLGEEKLQVPDLDRPEIRHEEKDVNVWALNRIAIGLVLLCITSLLIVFGVFRYFQREAELSEGGQPAGIGADARRLPPSPRLQETPAVDLKQMRDAEDQILGSYGWMDRQNGVVRIPVERAIDLLAVRGLPARPQSGPQSAASGVSVPTYSGLGPKMLPPGGPLNWEKTP